MVERVTIAKIRPRLTEIVGRIEHTDHKVIITRYGLPAAALVSMADLKRIWDAEEEERSGPRDPATGRRRGPLVRAADVVRGIWSVPEE